MMWAVVSRVGDILQLVGLVTIGFGVWKASQFSTRALAKFKRT